MDDFFFFFIGMDDLVDCKFKFLKTCKTEKE